MSESYFSKALDEIKEFQVVEAVEDGVPAIGLYPSLRLMIPDNAVTVSGLEQARFYLYSAGPSYSIQHQVSYDEFLYWGQLPEWLRELLIVEFEVKGALARLRTDPAREALSQGTLNSMRTFLTAYRSTKTILLSKWW